MKIKFIAFFCFVLFSQLLVAQSTAPENWYNLDKSTDNVQGVSTERAYKELLKDMKSETVIVAVIDSGIDCEHEDLKDIMWVNKDEIPGNNKDDDGNGYIDDIHGWNFIGGKNGEVDKDTYEATRLYGKLRKKYEGKSESDIKGKKAKKEFALFQKVEENVTKEREGAHTQLAQMSATEELIQNALNALEKALDGKKITAETVEAVDAVNNEDLGVAKRIVGRMFNEGQSIESIDQIRAELKEQVKGGIDYYQNKIDYAFNPDFNPRTIVGDNYSDSYEKGYGNNNYEGPDAFHGTHVAGIIGAVRDNEIGMKGVANNVRIMTVRAVPDGDERDKDVANAIIYAVDNGASIINMSFGKGFSWDKKAVDKAVKYAKKKDVLLVHAAGNSSKNTDEDDNFPVDYKGKANGDLKSKAFPNWIEVGALSWKGGEDAPAVFSNYGKKNIDLFAPGVAIYSTIPDNKYKNAQGTSMASPVVAGVAAVLRSYFPSLTALQVKEIVMSSAVKSSDKVKLPGSDELVPFSSLSVTGGVINVYESVKLAKNVKGKKKVKASTNKA